MKTISAILLFLSFTIFADSVRAQKIRAEFDPDSSHILKLVKTDRKLPKKVETDGAGKPARALSPDGKFKAYVLCVQSETSDTRECSGRVFIEDMLTRQVYEVSGEELSVEVGRPVDELKWKNAHTLSYERWTGPHFGHRYVINARTLKQTAAYILSDL